MPQRLPLLVRTASASERIVGAAMRLNDIFWDEVLCAWFVPRQRESINRFVWGTSESYLPGGASFERGLFEWERQAISEPPFPQAGRILLGGAGGGRELGQLCRRGFDVVAFDPSARLCEGARQVAGSFPNSVVVQASYRDLVTAVQDRTGPLAPHVLNTSFDAVFLGWASFSYVLTELDRHDLFCAARKIAPKAPLLLDFAVLQGAEDGKLDRLRPGIRRVCKLLGAPSVRRRGDLFHGTDFMRLTPPGEIEAVAGASGYRTLYIRWYNELCAYAMLMPL